MINFHPQPWKFTGDLGPHPVSLSHIYLSGRQKKLEEEIGCIKSLAHGGKVGYIVYLTNK